MEKLTPEQEAEKKKQERERELLIALFLLLVGDTNTYLISTCTTYLSGTMSVHTLSLILTTGLLNAHTQAAWMGRRLAGVTAPLGQPDQQFAQTVLSGQSRYITGLVNDLGRRRYQLEDDGSLPGDLTARLQLYARGLRGTAQETWTLSLPPDTLIHWRLGFVPEHHCTVCPEIAAAGPYRADNMPTVPGAGDTPCLGNCYCYLITEDGRRAFTL